VANDQNQLDIQNQINAALTARSALFKKQAGILEGQVMLARELCSALKCEDLEGMDDRLGEIKSSMEKAANEAERLPSTFDESSKSVKDVEGNLAGAAAATGALVKVVDSVKVGFLALKATGMALFDVFKAGFNIISAGYGVWNRFTSSIIAASSEAAQRGRVVAEAYEDLRDTFGDLSTGIGKEAVDAISQFDEAAAEAGVNAGRFFGPFAEGKAAQIKAIGEAISNLGALAIGPLAGQVAGASLEITMLQKGAGLSAEALQSLGNRALNAGQTLQGTMEDASRSIASVAKAMGVSTKTLGKNFDAIAKDVVTFGHLSVKEMTSLSAVMTKTGISMKTLQGVATGFDDFEKGADSVAKLSQAFGMQLNSVDMLNASDDERIAMLKESFMATGKSIDQLSRQERAYLATAAGVDANDLESVFGDQAASIEETKTQAELAQEAQISSAEAMQEMAKSIRTIFKPIKNFMSFFSAFMDGFQEGFLMSSEGLKDVYAALDKVFDIGLDLGKWVAKFIDDMGGFDKIFDLQFTIDMFQLLSDSIKGLLSGTMSLGDVFSNFFDMIKPKLMGMLEGVKKGLAAAWEWITGPGIDLMVEVFGKMWDYLTSPGMQKIYRSTIKSLFKGVKKVFKRAWNWVTSPEVKASVMGAFQGMWDYLTSPEMIKMYQDGLNALFTMAKDALVGAWNWVTSPEVKQSVTDALSSMWGYLTSQEVKDSITGALKTTWDFLKKQFDEWIVQPFANLLRGGLASIGIDMDDWLKQYTGLWKILKSVGTLIMNMFGTSELAESQDAGANFVDGLVDMISGSLDTVKGFVGTFLIPALKDGVNDGIDWLVKNGPGLLWGAIKLAFKGALALAVAPLALLFAAVWAPLMVGGFVWKKAFDVFMNLGSFMIGMVTQLFTKFVGWISEGLPEKMAEVRAAIVEKFNELKDNVGEIFVTIRETIMGLFPDFTTSVQDAMAPVSEAMSAIKESFLGTFGGISDAVIGTITTVKGLFTDFVGWVGGLLPTTVTDAVSTLTGKMTQPFEWLGEKWDSLKGMFPGGGNGAGGSMTVAVDDALKDVGTTEDVDAVAASIRARAAAFEKAQEMLGEELSGGVAVVRGMADDQNMITDLLSSLGEGGINLSTTIDKINKGVSTGASKIRLDSQKVTLNINVQVKLEADKLAQALADKTIVDPKYTLAQAGTGV